MNNLEQKTFKIKATYLENETIGVDITGGTDEELSNLVINNLLGLNSFIEEHFDLFEPIIRNNFQNFGFEYPENDGNPQLVDFIVFNILRYFEDNGDNSKKEVFLPLPTAGEIIAENLIVENGKLNLSNTSAYTITVESNKDAVLLIELFEFFYAITYNSFLLYMISEVEKIFNEQAKEKNSNAFSISFEEIIIAVNQVLTNITEDTSGSMLPIAVHVTLLKITQDAIADGTFELTEQDTDYVKLFA